VLATRGGIVGQCDRWIDQYAERLDMLASASAALSEAKAGLEYQEARLALQPAVAEGRTETERRYRLVMAMAADVDVLRATEAVRKRTLDAEIAKGAVQVLRERIAVERTYLGLQGQE
jgi:hypothetical protein